MNSSTGREWSRRLAIQNAFGSLSCFAAYGNFGSFPLPTQDRLAALPPSLRYYTPSDGRKDERTLRADVCVYGGTAGGVIAAVQAARLGRGVVLIEPSNHLGGMTSGGLSWTDYGNRAAVGGMALEVYQRIGKRYGIAEELKFEPKIAEAVLNEMADEAGIVVRRQEFLKSVKMRGKKIVSLTTETGLTIEAKVFIDATYEGDLLAKAGVRHTIGREGNHIYRETINGVQVHDKHQFDVPVSPYIREGDPDSGLLPHINSSVEPTGTGDRRIQAYNFRLCVTTKPENRIPFAQPPDYDRREYVLLERTIRAGSVQVFGKFDPIRNGKIDKNNHGAVSTDFIGMSDRWPEAGYRERDRIFRKHVNYQMGWFWFLCNDAKISADIRNRMSQYGLCKDEFTETGGWPHQIYVREGRRMVSDTVMTEHNCRCTISAEDSVGLASYGMDSHNCQRVVIDGKVKNEGDVQVPVTKPYPVSYRAIVPRKGDCENLLVPVCLSCSHIAYGSIRMEPVFMMLGQSAAFAAHLAIQRNSSMQEVNYAELKPLLEKSGQVLRFA
jgi:hypothetical protein